MKKVKLSSISKIYNGNSINAKVKAEKYSIKVAGRNYIATKDIKLDGTVTYSTGVIIPFAEAKFKIAPSDCVLVCSEGGSAGRKTAHISQDVCFGNKLFAITNDKNLFNSKYVYFFTRYNGFFDQFQSLMNGIIGGVSVKKFGEIEIPLPSLVVQDKIVEKIEKIFYELDSSIKILRKTKEQLTRYRQSVLKDAFVEMPSCEMTTLGQCIVNKPRNGFSPKAVDYETPYKNLTLTATTSGVFKDGYFKYIDIDISGKSHLWVKRNDILIQRANTIDYVGASAIYLGENNEYVYPDLMMKIHTIDTINPKFILYQLQTLSVKKYFQRNATGTAGNMPKINQAIVLNTPIVVCEMGMQTKIVQEIESKLSICDNVERQIDEQLKKAEKLRQSILKQAFEGWLI